MLDQGTADKQRHVAGIKKATAAGFFLRVLARLIDVLALSLIVLVLIAVGLLSTVCANTDTSTMIVWAGLAGPATLIYFVGFTTRGGQTAGKWLTGIRVIDSQGQPPSLRTALVRQVTEACLTVLIPVLGGLCNYLWVAVSPNKRSLHDLAARTHVIRVGRYSPALVLMLSGVGALSPFVVNCAVQQYWISCSIVRSSAMEPTVQPGDLVIADRLAYVHDEPAIGDVVLVKIPVPLHQGAPAVSVVISVKRVVGLPGDVLCCRQGILWRNGEAVREPYVRTPMECKWPGLPQPYRVARGHVVLLGDNRDNSYDSSHYGPVPIASIIGQVLVVASPEGEFEPVQRGQ